MANDDHEIRELKHKLRRANKTMGTQGETIYRLRGALAVVREEHSKIERGEIRRLERDLESLNQLLEKQRERNRELHAQLRETTRESAHT